MKNTIKHNEFFQYFSRSQCISDPVPGIWFIKIVKIWQIWLIDYLFLHFYTMFKGYFPFIVISKHRLCSPFVQYILENTLYPVGYTYHSPNPCCPCPLPTGNHWLVLCICESFFSIIVPRLLSFSDFTCKWDHIALVFIWLPLASFWRRASSLVPAQPGASGHRRGTAILAVGWDAA